MGGGVLRIPPELSTVYPDDILPDPWTSVHSVYNAIP
jgi:hypothetical protein